MDFLSYLTFIFIGIIVGFILSGIHWYYNLRTNFEVSDVTEIDQEIL